MKRIIYYIITLMAATSAINSCDTLEQMPVDKLYEDNAFLTEDDLALYTNSFYTMFPSAYNVFYADRISDYIAPVAINKLFLGTFTAQDSGNWTWGALRNVNYFLKHYDNPDIPQEARLHYGGLARMMRAFFYFEKVKRFGDVPWYDAPLEADDPALYKTQDSREFIMNKVLEDINYACDNMRGRDGGNLKNTDCTVIDRYVALALKSRICLYEGTWRKYHGLTSLNPTADKWLEECADASEQLMECPLFKLNTNGETPYGDLFTSDSANKDEFIMALVFSAGFQVYHDANWRYTSPSYGEKLGLIHQFINTYLNADGTRFTDKAGYDEMEFQNEVKDRDPRLAQTIRCGAYIRSDEKNYAPDFGAVTTGYQIRKWVVDDVTLDSRAESTNCVPLFRYAEVLLNYAEAKCELGEFSEDIWDKTIGLIRSRAGITDCSMPASADQYMQNTYFPDITDANLLEIRRERAIELCAEGFRFDDIKRWKRGELMTMEYQGIYVPSEGMELDLNEDGVMDVGFVKKQSWQVNTYQVLLGSTYVLAKKNYGRLIYNANATDTFPRVWEDKMYVYPVPYDETIINPNLKQPAGWQ